MAAPAHIARENGKKGGRPKGRKNNDTIAKETTKALELEYIKQRVSEAKGALISAQISLATGTQYLYKIEKKKVKGPKGGISYQPQRPKLVTAQCEIESYLAGLIEEGEMDDDSDPGATYYYLTTEKPENEAIKNLLDRVVGKPKESLELSGEVKLSLRDLAAARAKEA